MTNRLVQLGLRLGMLIALCLSTPVFAEEMPRFVKQGDRFALMVDGKPFFMMAAQLHSSSASSQVLSGGAKTDHGSAGKVPVRAA